MLFPFPWSTVCGFKDSIHAAKTPEAMILNRFLCRHRVPSNPKSQN
jgi:hypothetical protein